MATVNEARQLPTQQVHYIRKDIAHDTPGMEVADTVVVGVLPPGAYVVDTVYTITEAWNSGTSNTLIVGTADDDDEFLTAIDAKATAGTSARVTTGLGYESSAGDVVYAKITTVGAAPTAGEATIAIMYLADNDG